MGTYKGIQGYSVQKLSDDPTPTAQYLGQLFYNSTSGKFKIAIQDSGTWSSAAAMNRGRYGGAGAGTKAAGLVAGGASPPPLTYGFTETYNGTTWTEVGDLNTVRTSGFLGTGTITAAIVAGGGPGQKNAAETWDGTSWSSVNSMLVARQALGGFGTSTAALAGGGGAWNTPSTKGLTELYDGSSWSETTDQNQVWVARKGCGTVSTLGIYAGGYNNPPATSKASTEQWNGSTWTNLNDLNQTRYDPGMGGSTTDALCFGGNRLPDYLPINNTEKYDGTSWAAGNTLATARGASNFGASCPTPASFCASGNANPGGPPTADGVVEEFTDPVYAIKTVTVS